MKTLYFAKDFDAIVQDSLSSAAWSWYRRR